MYGYTDAHPVDVKPLALPAVESQIFHWVAVASYEYDDVVSRHEYPEYAIFRALPNRNRSKYRENEKGTDELQNPHFPIQPFVFQSRMLKNSPQTI